MLNSAMNYPYPVLRKEKVDYKDSTFEAKLSKKNLKDGYQIKVEYSVSNAEIQQLIDEKKPPMLCRYNVFLRGLEAWK